MKKVVLLLCIPINLVFSQKVVCINVPELNRTIIAYCQFDIKQNSIYISTLDNIYEIDPVNGRLKQTLLDQKQFYRPYKFFIKEDLVITESFKYGKQYLHFINRKTKTHHKTLHHPTLDYIAMQGHDSTIIVGGSHLTSYARYLELYDENTKSPSRSSLVKFDELYRSHRAYTLAKYDFELNLIDSCNFSDRTGDDYQGYQELFLSEVFDMDETGNIYTVHQESGMIIRKYSPDFKLQTEFSGENINYKPVPKNLTAIKANRLKRITGAHSRFLSIHAVNDTIITVFYHYTGAGAEAPFYVDMYSQEGEKIYSGELPYRILVRDESGKLYSAIKHKEGRMFGKEKYYLVSFTPSDLLRNRVNEAFFETAIKNMELKSEP